MGIFFILIPIVAIIFLAKLKIRINFKSFFKKGFEKEDDQHGVYCYCGKQGTGKTYSAIEFILQKRQNNQKIITNVKSFYDKNKKICIYEPDIMKIIKKCENEQFRNTYIIFFDEIFTLLEKQTRMNKEILAFLSQMRKRGIYFITTAQEWLEINITFRRYTRYQIECNMFNLPLFKKAICVNPVYDATKMKWSQEDNEYVAPIVQTNIKKGNIEIINQYDTYETISTSKS